MLGSWHVLLLLPFADVDVDVSDDEAAPEPAGAPRRSSIEKRPIMVHDDDEDADEEEGESEDDDDVLSLVCS